jgi:hypothetical protein
VETIVSDAEQNDRLAYEQRLNERVLNRADLRKEREVILDLYKHHLNLLLQANVFIYAVTGALLSFVFIHLNVPGIRLILAFPVVFSLGFAIFLYRARRNINNSMEELIRIAKALNVNTYPMIDALPMGLSLSAVVLLLVAALVTAGAFFIK